MAMTNDNNADRTKQENIEFTPQEAAEFLGKGWSRVTIWRWTVARRIPFRCYGPRKYRYPKNELIAWQKGQTYTPKV